MTSKAYFRQAYRLDQRINAKIEQLTTLNDLATKCTTVITGMPGNPNKGRSSVEEIVVKIIALENEINDDIDSLVDLKSEMVRVIKAVNNTELQTLLELRYLCFKTWEQIASELDYTVDNVYRLHREALKYVRIPERLQ